ncbi:hypothetical protein ACCO45_006761 [Purpureocillium lilacinum]|uniref:Uncharacterized protein n=1 Tax=Purpureocillium lilacinum TaxID=33203 RepID=A0ACC4DRV0_PURLI
MLRQFHFIDQNGKDQGINVRNRAKELAELLSDVDRIRSERKKARATKNKYTGVEGGMSFGGGFSGGSSSGRYGGFGSESAGYGGGNANYGGYSGGVYGDGGGFGGQASDFRDTSGRSDRFEEYDEFDEGERPAASSRPKRTTERAGVKKTTGEVAKKKEPEVDLFSFDEPSQSSSAAAPTPSNGSGLADLGGPSGSAANDDDEFDDFQEATPPLSAPQKADLSQMVSTSSISPAPSAGVNYSAFASPPRSGTGSEAVRLPIHRSQLLRHGLISAYSGERGHVSHVPNGDFQRPDHHGQHEARHQPRAKPAAAGGDAFGALWGKASGGVKKTGTPTAGASMGQLAKEKSAAGIWGAPASASSQPAAGRPAPSGGSASDDLLG